MNHTDPRKRVLRYSRMRASRIAGMRAGRKGMGDLATREEPEASLGRTWKLESGCAAKVPCPKYTHAQSCQSQFRQPRSVSRPNQINLFQIRSRPRGVLAIVSWFAIESCDQQWAGKVRLLLLHRNRLSLSSCCNCFLLTGTYHF